MRKLIFFLFFILIFSFKGYSITYYFDAINGNDSRSPTQAQSNLTAWQTITKLNSFFPSLVAGDSVLFRRGQTFTTNVGIIINRSGGVNNPIVIGAWGSGDRPIITSLINLTFVNLSGNLWRSNELISLPSPSLNCVTVNNVIVQRARWPQNTWNTDSLATSTTITQKAANSQLNGQPSYTTGTEPSGVVYRSDRFEVQTGTITAHSTGPAKITFTKTNATQTSPNAPGWGYFVQNDSTILTSSPYQNAWYWKKNKYLKVYSVGSPSNFAAATSSNLISTVGTFNWLVFDNINLNGCNGDMVFINQGSNITIQDCILQNSGRNGVKLATDSITIIRDSIVNSSSKGITTSAGADHCNFSYNTIRNQGQIIGNASGNVEDGHANHDGVGVYILDNTNNEITIEHNVVVNSGYSAIQFKRQDTIIVRYNYIDTFCNVTDDGGGIYSYSADGTVVNFGRKTISNIILHGIGAKAGQPSPTEAVKGIYLDEWTNHDIVDSNTVAYNEDGMFANNGCNLDFIRNNTFFGSRSASMHMNTRSTDHTVNMTLTNNLCYADTIIAYCNLLHTADYNLTTFGTINFNYYIKPLIVASSTLLLRSEGPGGAFANYSLATWQSTFTYDASSTISPYHFTSSSHQSDSLIFRFNSNPTAQTTSLPGTYRDIYGATYIGSVTIQPFSSVILFLISSSIPTQNSKDFIIRRKIIVK